LQLQGGFSIQNYDMTGSNLYLTEADSWLYKDRAMEQKINMTTDASGYPNYIPLEWCDTTFLGWHCPDLTGVTLEYWKFWDLFLYVKVKDCQNVIVP